MGNIKASVKVHSPTGIRTWILQRNLLNLLSKATPTTTHFYVCSKAWGGFHKVIYALCLNFAFFVYLTLGSPYCSFFQIWVRSKLYAVQPTFIKSTPVNLLKSPSNTLNNLQCNIISAREGPKKRSGVFCALYMAPISYA